MTQKIPYLFSSEVSSKQKESIKIFYHWTKDVSKCEHHHRSVFFSQVTGQKFLLPILNLPLSQSLFFRVRFSIKSAYLHFTLFFFLLFFFSKRKQMYRWKVVLQQIYFESVPSALTKDVNDNQFRLQLKELLWCTQNPYSKSILKSRQRKVSWH